MNASNQVQIHLESVNEVKFMLNLAEGLLEQAGSNGPNIGFAHAVSANIEKSIIILLFGVQYAVEDTPILECRYEFIFKINPIKDVVKIGKNKIEIKGLMPHFISVAIGTMRGIIVAKTAGTPLAQYPLPMLDPQSVLDNMMANMPKE